MVRIKNTIIFLMILGFIMLWVGLVVCGVTHVWQRSDVKKNKQFRIDRIEQLQETVVELREEVYILESCVYWETILSETLSSQEKVELDVIEASLRNKIQKSFPNK